MSKEEKGRKLALRLSILTKSDQKWLLTKIDRDLAQIIETEITAIYQLGLENPNSLIDANIIVDKNTSTNENNQAILQILEYSPDLSLVEQHLLEQCLVEQDRIELNKRLSRRQRKRLAKYSSIHCQTISQNFKHLFLTELAYSLGIS